MKTNLLCIAGLLLLPAMAIAQQSAFSGAIQRLEDANGNIDYLAPLQYLQENKESLGEFLRAGTGDF